MIDAEVSMRPRFPLALAFAVLSSAPAWAQSLSGRLQGVQDHIKKQGESGPDHLWVGIALAVAFAAAVALAALWTLRRRPKN